MATQPEATLGVEMYALIERLYPICRSITGDGLRQTLAIINEHIPLAITEVPSGTPAFDWTVPNEWNIREAWIKDRRGEAIVDFRAHNLHVVNYSVPIHRRMALTELGRHLHSLPEHPRWIPYRTSYYHEDWGFCLPHEQLEALTPDGEYEVLIDSTLRPGALTYGECLIRGASDSEVLVFTHVCHPSLANDNLSGIAVCTSLARGLLDRRTRYSYRFVFAPGTIGAIAWLSRNENALPRIAHGLVAVLLGDRGAFTYKRTRRGDAEIDRAAVQTLQDLGCGYRVTEFEPYGYDERQFGSPGIDLPVGRLTRTPNAGYSEYHTSADDLNFIDAASLAESYTACAAILDTLERDRRYVNLSPKCEPQLGKRGLYARTGGQDIAQRERALLWVLNQSDGKHSLLDIAGASAIKFDDLARAADDLAHAGLLMEAPGVERSRTLERTT